MKVLFCAYRTWAIETYDVIKNQNPSLDINLARSEEEFYFYINEWNRPDIIVMVGWSWIIPKEIVEQLYVVGFHPSDLPNYSGGSPIQHQIIEGIEQTKGTLFRASPILDSGPIVYKETLDLSGDMTNIFKNLTECSTRLVGKFLQNYPNVPNLLQEKTSQPRKRLKPKDSKITKLQIEEMTSKQLYNFIRGRGDPYPNVYLEDSSGKLFFKEVRYEEKKND